MRQSAESAGLPAPNNMMDLIAGGSSALAQMERVVSGADAVLSEAEIRYAPAVPAPSKIVCVGANYRRHALEANLPMPEKPVYFPKFANGLAAHGEDVVLPDVAHQFDYEVELVAVIGRRTRKVTAADALDGVFGYATGNDLSARDLQMRNSQWLFGKALDGFAPLGPYVVTADEVPDPQDLTVQTWVNGELRQNSNTKDMIFSVAEMVSDLSQIMTLEPGDVIYTGTPEGVILGMQDKVWLRPGDEVACEIDGLGRLVNTLVADKSD